MLIERFTRNPLITPSDLAPTRSDFQVAAVLNPAVARYGDETILLLRVAEQPLPERGWVRVPLVDWEQGDDYRWVQFRADDPTLDATDPRVITRNGVTYLTSISHLRVARSRDGVNFRIDPEPLLTPNGPDESYGVEDARVTQIGDVYYIHYVAVSPRGVITRMATTTDWRHIERGPTLFAPMNKDVAIFPQQIAGAFVALHRPDPGPFAPPSMWLARSPDLVYWGRHQFLMGVRPGQWDAGRIGAGTVPVLTEHGWLAIYHGADEQQRYCLGMVLLDAEDPARIIYRSDAPLLCPDEHYERDGFFNDVVFTNGWACFPERGGEAWLYYGAADERVCGARANLAELVAHCRPRRPGRPQKVAK